VAHLADSLFRGNDCGDDQVKKHQNCFFKYSLTIKNQLAEGGRMIIPVDEFYGQSLVFIEKRKGKLREGKVLPVRFVPMINENGKEY
jgi:hypothetical protein